LLPAPSPRSAVPPLGSTQLIQTGAFFSRPQSP